MKNIITSITIFSFCLLSWNTANGQEIVNDTICITTDEAIMYNVSANDDEVFQSVNYRAVLVNPDNNCFALETTGELFFIANNPEECCGVHELEYTYIPNEPSLPPYQGPPGIIHITVKCPKPECGIVDLDDLPEDPAGASGGKPTISACEGSVVTYFVTDVPGTTYTWTVTGGTDLTASNSSIIDIQWGVTGSGMITVVIDNGSSSVTRDFCVDILDAPVADFMPVNDCACLNSPITFINNSIGGSSYYWDFGDGNTTNTFQPTHTYAVAGVYSVTLVVTKDNYDEEGNPLCCCSDSIAVDIEIDPRPGPDIYWISTLCPGDSTKYWTDDIGCTYLWSVEEADGTPIIPTPTANPDTICVTWGDGPYGIVTLQATGCPTICDKPVSAVVPIISTVEDIIGEVVVCDSTTYSYDLPKWPTVTYDWQVTGALSVVGNGSHSVDITWGAPGPGYIHVDYCSDFLGGLPGHEAENCCGTADLNVNIKEEYFLIPPDASTVCVGDTSTYETSHPSAGFNWTVTPSATIIGNGTYQVDIIWPTTGVYEVLVHPTGLNPFCNDTIYHYMNVVDIAQPDSITGDLAVCPLDTKTYFAHSSESGVGYEWDVIGGTPTSFTGNPITVTWDAAGPYSLCVAQFQLSDPECVSDTICQTIIEKTIDLPLTLSGPDGCVNTVKNYSLGPMQTFDVDYEWMIMPANMGSVITDPNSDNVDIQWNNVAGSANLTAKVILCGVTESITIPITVHPSPIVNITQLNSLCVGGTADLSAGTFPGGTTYQWSPGSGTTSTITISSPGVYSLTVTDNNSCTSIDTYEVFTVEGPQANISSPDPNKICNGTGNSATLHTLDNPDWEFDWYCNGTLQSQPAGQAFFVHNDNSTTGTYSYYVVVTNTVTGCVSVSTTYLVYQSDCTGGGTGGGCDGEDYELIADNMNQTPYCNTVDFSTPTISGNVTLTGWNYGDLMSGGPGATTHTYNEARYYIATVTGTVPSNVSGTCPASATTSVCIPLAADFEYSVECDKVTFTDASSYLTGHDITSWSWDFGGDGTGSGPTPMHTFSGPGTYLITLEVEDISAPPCKAIYTELITISADPNPVISTSPSIVCVEDAIDFSISGTGTLISYDWDFGDGSGNGGAMPSHSYLTAGSKTINVTVTDANGCEGISTTTVIVHPNPTESPIAISPDDIVCDGESVTLTAAGGNIYIWSDGYIGNPNIVNASGTYHATVTDANGCNYVTDPVDITVLPPLDATVVGDTVICESGCVVLSAPSGYNYSYVWSNSFTTKDVTICSPGSFQVTVTDDNMCTAISQSVNVVVKPKPIVGIDVVGDLCAGTDNILTANPILANVDYYWSTGYQGTSITSALAGNYTLYGRDTLTGCVGSASVTINPLPDLCIVPTGCYEICNPDTICGPDGMAMYQWNMNGLPIPGETMQCLIVDESGSYSLTAKNSYDCYNTSDSLILMVVPCCEEQTVITATKTTTVGDTCCFDISYLNDLQGVNNLAISINEGEILYPTSLDIDFQVALHNPFNLILQNFDPSMDLPLGNYPLLTDLCIKSDQWPKTVYFDWRDDNDIICMDSLILECSPEPPCIYLLDSDMYCEDDLIFYNLTICNPSDAAFDITYIDLQSFAPAGATFSPSVLDLTGSPLMAGDCNTYTVQLLGSGLANQTLCFNLIGHATNPLDDPSALCCSLDTMYYQVIPGCSDCDNLYISDIMDGASGDSCCYDITIFNNLDDNLIDGIDLCVLTTGGSISVDVTDPNWLFTSTSSTYTQLGVPINSAGSNFLDFGAYMLPEICVNDGSPYITQVEIKWLNGADVICRDTIDLTCDTDCGNLANVDVTCLSDGTWDINLSIQNTSGYTMETAFIQFNDPGMDIYNTNVPLGLLADGATSGPIIINVGPPATGGSNLDITVVLHSLGHDDNHVHCCEFDAIIWLPECDGSVNCECDDEFEEQVSLGASIVSLVGNTAMIVPNGNFSECDQVVWDWIYMQFPFSNLTIGNDPVSHTFPNMSGEYDYCMTVIRTQPNDKQCKFKYTGQLELILIEGNELTVYPNPTMDKLQMELSDAIPMDEKYEAQLYDLEGMLIMSQTYTVNLVNQPSLDLTTVNAGIYLLVVKYNDSVWNEKIIVMK